jgi:hypothetical protein
MKKLLAVLLLTGCASQLTPEQKLMVLVDRYGPRCDAMGISRQSEQFVHCIAALYKTEFRQPTVGENLSYGFGAAGSVLIDPTPRYSPRQIEYTCLNNCLGKGYMLQFCNSACSY